MTTQLPANEELNGMSDRLWRIETFSREVLSSHSNARRVSLRQVANCSSGGATHKRVLPAETEADVVAAGLFRVEKQMRRIDARRW